MKNLVSLLEEQGYQDVKSYIQSGNVVLKSKKITATDISSLVSDNFGFTPEVMVLTKKQFLTAIKNNPFQPGDGKLAHFYFCNEKPVLNKEKVGKYADASEEYKLIDKVFYLHAPNGIGRSKLVANIESCLGVPATGRNMNTISKLEEILSKS